MSAWLSVVASFLVAIWIGGSTTAEDKPTPPKRPVLVEVLTPEVAISGIARFKVDNLEGLDASRFRLILDDHAFHDLAPQYGVGALRRSE